MATTRRARHLCLVAVDGAQVAPAPRRRSRDLSKRWEREIRLCVIKEHLGHITHSLLRLSTLVGELEVSCGISVGDCTPWPLPDALNPDPPSPFDPSA